MFKKKKKRKSIFKRLLGVFIPSWSLSRGARKGIFLIFFLLLGLLCLFGYLGKAGELGSLASIYLGVFFGYAKWSVPVLLFLTVIALARNDDDDFDGANVFGIGLFLISISGLLYFWNTEIGGGILGSAISPLLIDYLGSPVSAVLLSSLVLISLILILNTSLSNIIGEGSILFRMLIFLFGIIFYPLVSVFRAKPGMTKVERIEDDGYDLEFEDDKGAVIKEYDIEEDDKGHSLENNFELSDESSSHDLNEKDKKNFNWKKTNLKINIPLDLLRSKTKKPTSGNIVRYQEIIKQTLADFGIPINMGDVTVGPTITQYTFKPANGISVSRVKFYADDLAMNLAVHPVRIEAPIPGKPFVGLEIPNQTKVLVSLKEVLKSKVFTSRKSNTIIPMGRDVTGKVWLDDLVKMPHVLIAGQTASGKSVFLHSLIISLMFQNNPDDLKFVMIDQKQVELSMYDKIPYLIAPVITEHKRAIRALQWCVEEMDKRLTIINKAGCQNMLDYNKRKPNDSMPCLVVVVDELGDLLSTSKKEAEGAIIRLGQKSRAAGIHLVLATQRPSVDILSGLIKANLPARAAFSVTSSVNSKTILEHTGAEKLLGHGDMLYINSAMSKPVRIQGTYIDKAEIKEVVRYIKKKSGVADYEVEFEGKGQSDFDFGGEDEEGDVMMEEARKMILDSGKASATMLQSRLGIGYPRANRILDNLEKQGVVGPSIQNKPRDVFVE
ncbi:MAG: DNA translocase FtsK 4TM domain-containing protein [Patescibacteria group bacterium]|jgi:S-DNA-T family DNA segregation ATPase FtsK/SpoIIIE|nr:DNA translocase FtsK 4TM domain-containing protein [Patescibacteria group bacterium]